MAKRRSAFPAGASDHDVAGLRQHGLELSDVLAVTQDLGLWAICRSGIFRADLRGVFKKRIEVERFIPYAEVGSVREEPSGPKTGRLVLTGHDGKELARMDFGAGGMENTPELAVAHRERIFRILERVTA
jgi:hypothetical protein